MNETHEEYSKHTHRKHLAPRTKAALWLLFAPTVLLFVSLALFVLVNAIFNPTFWPTPDTEAVYDTPLAITILNGVCITLFATGALAWLPGIIAGTVLLAKKPTN